MTEIIARISEIGIVPVIVLDDPCLARPLADALAEGGLPCAEVTFRTPRAAHVLTVMARDPHLVAGAGTVLTVAQVDAAEIQMALADGITLVKFFPAEASGGTRALSAIAGPFPMLRFIPTGGISPDNLDSYLALPSVAAVGGSWMVTPGLVSGRKWTDISRLAAEAVAAVARHR